MTQIINKQLPERQRFCLHTFNSTYNSLLLIDWWGVLCVAGNGSVSGPSLLTSSSLVFQSLVIFQEGHQLLSLFSNCRKVHVCYAHNNIMYAPLSKFNAAQIKNYMYMYVRQWSPLKGHP